MYNYAKGLYYLKITDYYDAVTIAFYTEEIARGYDPSPRLGAHLFPKRGKL